MILPHNLEKNENFSVTVLIDFLQFLAFLQFSCYTFNIMIYLDYAAHTPADPRVLDSFLAAERQPLGNGSAAHPAGDAARALMEDAARRLAQAAGATGFTVIFTSGASEANNLAIRGMARANRAAGRHIISTPLEHPSVSAPLTALQEQGWEVELLPVKRGGQIDLAQLQARLRPDTALVSLCLADSELGVPQPIQEAAALLRQYPRCLLHVDATQAFGKLPVNLEGVDACSLSPHKFFGIVGSGALLLREGTPLEPLILGGRSSTEYRSGSPAPGLAVAAAHALELAQAQRQERFAYVSNLREHLLQFLQPLTAAHLNIDQVQNPYIINLSLDGIQGAQTQLLLAERGICVSVKSACSAPNLPSRAVYNATGDKKRARTSFRVSLSHLTTEAELEQFCEALKEVVAAHGKY